MPPILIPSGVLRTQKFSKVPSVENPELTNVLRLMPGVGQKIATHASPICKSVFFVLISTFPVYIFPFLCYFFGFVVVVVVCLFASLVFLFFVLIPSRNVYTAQLPQGVHYSATMACTLLNHYIV